MILWCLIICVYFPINHKSFKKVYNLLLPISLYTYEGQQVTDGPQLESGQLYVAVGREKFKKLPYSDLLFPKPRGTRRANG